MRFLTPLSFGGSGSVTAAAITDSSSTGRAVLTATDAAAARTATGAGTSSLAIGTTGTTAAAGNDGRLSDTRVPSAASVDHTKVNATGTPSATTYLRGDDTWSTPAGGSGGIASVSADTTPALGGNLNVGAYSVGAAVAADLTKLHAVTASAATINNQSGTNTGDQTLPTTLPPNGAAGGALAGTYPNPTIAAGASLTSPTLITPALGTPASGNLTSCTFPTLNQNTTGTAGGLSATLGVASGGTGATTLTGILKGAGTAAVTAVTAPAGTIVGTTDTQTLTSKTLTAPTLTAPVLGTPASGALTNCTFPTLNQSTTGSAATLTTPRAINGVNFDGSAAITIKPRVNTTASSATPAINTDTTDHFTITALAAAITSMTTSLTGTPVDGQKLMIRIKDNGTARAITWGTSFQSSGVATLLATTAISKTHHVGLIYDSASTKWTCIAVDSVGY